MLHITKLNKRNTSPPIADAAIGSGMRTRPDMATQTNPTQNNFELQAQTKNDNPDQIGNRLQIPGSANLRPADAETNPGVMNPFISLLLWILGEASSEGLNTILSMFGDARDQGLVYAESPRHDDDITHTELSLVGYYGSTSA